MILIWRENECFLVIFLKVSSHILTILVNYVNGGKMSILAFFLSFQSYINSFSDKCIFSILTWKINGISIFIKFSNEFFEVSKTFINHFRRINKNLKNLLLQFKKQKSFQII